MFVTGASVDRAAADQDFIRVFSRPFAVKPYFSVLGEKSKFYGTLL
jgi:hypothetical protein